MPARAEHRRRAAAGRWLGAGLWAGLGLLSISAAQAQAILTDPDGNRGEQTLALPFPFYNENFGFAAGFVYGVVGKPQPQSALLGTAMAGTKGSGMLTLIGRDLRLPKTDRLFLDPFVSIGYFNEIESYIDGNPDFAGERAGSNGSDQDDFVKGDGFDNFFRLRFKYILPTGRGEDEIVSTYRLDRGLPLEPRNPTSAWNPLVSGKSYLEVSPFYRSQEIDGNDVDEDVKTNGFDLSYYWDNRDFFINPSAGHSLRLGVSRDFGLFDSTDSWTVLDAEFDEYFSLGATDWFRQRVIALNAWTANTPTWEVQRDGTVDNRAPAYTGATLGGLWRMRAFPSQRFNDKAAIYYGAELRLIPDWNPFVDWPTIQKYVGVQWLQVVPFIEVGRVAPEWDLKKLHSNMKWDVGLGLRAFAKGLVVRLDTAVSDEGAAVQMMVSQPFQF